MELDVTTSMSAIDVIRMRREDYKPLGIMERAFLSTERARTLTNYPTDIDTLLSEIDRLTDELCRARTRELSRLNAHLHIDTEPKRRKTVSSLPCVGITTARGVLQEGGCIAVNLDRTEALITAQNVAVGRLRPGTKNELRDAGELPIMATGHGSFVTYSQHVFLHDPAECKV